MHSFRVVFDAQMRPERLARVWKKDVQDEILRGRSLVYGDAEREALLLQLQRTFVLIDVPRRENILQGGISIIIISCALSHMFLERKSLFCLPT